MRLNIHLVPIAVASVLMLPAGANAQNAMNWSANQTGQIQQDLNSGLINAGQAAALQNREAQIQAQTQREILQNGGTLNPLQQRQLNSELRGVNKALGKDIRRDNPGLALPNGYVPPVSGYQNWNRWNSSNWNNPNGAVTPHHHHHNLNWQNGQFWGH